MKKITLITLIFFALMSCKKQTMTNTNTNNNSTDTTNINNTNTYTNGCSDVNFDSICNGTIWKFRAGGIISPSDTSAYVQFNPDKTFKLRDESAIVSDQSFDQSKHYTGTWEYMPNECKLWVKYTGGSGSGNGEVQREYNFAFPNSNYTKFYLSTIDKSYWCKTYLTNN